MKVEDILKQKGDQVYKILDTDSVLDAVKEMNDKKVGSLVVVNSQQEIIGIISERDILKHFEEVKNPGKIQIKEIMTSAETMFIAKKSDNTTSLMGIMTRNKIRHLPVLELDKVVGLVSIGDIIKAMLEESEQESRLLRDYVKSPYGIPHV